MDVIKFVIQVASGVTIAVMTLPAIASIVPNLPAWAPVVWGSVITGTVIFVNRS